jgi:hypothetical protein
MKGFLSNLLPLPNKEESYKHELANNIEVFGMFLLTLQGEQGLHIFQ